MCFLPPYSSFWQENLMGELPTSWTCLDVSLVLLRFQEAIGVSTADAQAMRGIELSE